MGKIIEPGQMQPPAIQMNRRGELPDGRMVISAEVVQALRRLRNWHKHGIQLPGRSLEDLVENVFHTMYTSQGCDFEIKT